MKEAAYLHLYRQLRDAIVEGVYPFGSKLPPKRTLAADTGRSLITVEHAYALLCEEGYVMPRERSGYYVCYQRDTSFSSPAEPAPSFSTLLSEDQPATEPAEETAFPPHFPFSVLAKAMRRVLSTYGEKIWERSPDRGHPLLREAIGEYLARSRGIRVRPEQIIIGSGAEFLYAMVVGLLGRDKIYGLENPSYEKIRQVYEGNGAGCEMLTMGPDGILSEALEASLAQVLHVTPFHSYPSGVTAGASKRREYLNWAEKRGATIVEDDYDSEFTLSSKSVDTLFALSPQGRVIYLNSFTKTIAPSLRLAYMILPEGLLPLFEEKLAYYSCSVPVFEQIVLAQLIENGDFERHINRVRRNLRKL